MSFHDVSGVETFIVTEIHGCFMAPTCSAVEAVVAVGVVVVTLPLYGQRCKWRELQRECYSNGELSGCGGVYINCR